MRGSSAQVLMAYASMPSMPGCVCMCSPAWLAHNQEGNSTTSAAVAVAHAACAACSCLPAACRAAAAMTHCSCSRKCEVAAMSPGGNSPRARCSTAAAFAFRPSADREAASRAEAFAQPGALCGRGAHVAVPVVAGGGIKAANPPLTATPGTARRAPQPRCVRNSRHPRAFQGAGALPRGCLPAMLPRFSVLHLGLVRGLLPQPRVVASAKLRCIKIMHLHNRNVTGICIQSGTLWCTVAGMFGATHTVPDH
jgi:hypothetical protein